MTINTRHSYETRLQRWGRHGFLVLCTFIFFFLLAPIVAVAPLALNDDPYFSFPIRGYSLRWFVQVFTDPAWTLAIRNSLLIGGLATLLSTTLGTLAALGLCHANLPGRRLIMALLISPMIVPVIILAVGAYFFYSTLGIANNIAGIVLAHAALGLPFVVITVTATLSGFDHGLTRAARSLGASPFTAFRRVMLPIVWPGVLSGALFAFGTSFDEVVVVLFLGGPEERTLPRQMWAGLREQLSPAILAAAVLLVAFSVVLLVSLEILRRRNVAMRGIRE